MSAIYFHTKDEGTKAIRGSERRHFGNLCNHVLMAAIGAIRDTQESPHWLRRMVPASHYLRTTAPEHFAKSAEAALSVSDDLHLTFPGTDETADPFTLALNTAIAVGPGPLCLAARIHGQCEIHSWVDGHNRAWLADIIDHGCRVGLFRHKQGWAELLPWLRAREDAPVVLSYSVCDSFSPHNEDAAEEDQATAWGRGMRWLREQSGGLELKPEGFGTFFFGSRPITGFHLAPLASGAMRLDDIRPSADP
jgi:hypothetical protein